MSLIGGNYAPYRLPAGGVPFYCAVYKHAIKQVIATKYTNTTTISGSAPGERYVDLHTSGGCDQNNNCPSGNPCKPWIGTQSDQYTPVLGLGHSIPANAFAAGGAVNFDVCHKRGFKAVKAKVYWNGSYGFLDYDGNGNNCYDHPCVSGDPISGWQGYQSAPDSIKYLNRTAVVYYSNRQRTGSVHVNHDGSLGAFTWVSDVTNLIQLTGSLSINQNSGEKTFNASVWTATQTDNLAHTTTDISGSGIASNVWASGGSWPACTSDIDTSGLSVPFTMPDPRTLPGYSQTGWSFDYTQPYPAAGVLTGYTNEQKGTVTRGNTDYHMVLAGTTRDGDAIPDSDASVVFQDYLYDCEISLGSTNNQSGILVDLKTLLNYWPLNDDSLYPWRTDGLVQVTPLMSRLQNKSDLQDWPSPGGMVDDYSTPTGSPPYAAWGQRAWFDTNVYHWCFPAGQDQTTAAGTLVKFVDGSILGAPQPAGYQGYFDFRFENHRMCPTDHLSPCLEYIYSYYPDLQWYRSNFCSGLPQNCTQWTNNYLVANHPPFAFVGNDQGLASLTGGPHDGSCIPNSLTIGDGAVWYCKYAECAETWQSINFARPAGADKFLIDETQTYCAANISGTGAGSTWTITDSLGNTPADAAISGGIWGGLVFSGFYNVTSYTSGTLTLGAKQFSAPSDWHSRSGDDATAFGKLRWSSAPSLLGRIPTTAIVDANGNQPFSHAADPGQHGPIGGGGPVDWVPTYQFANAQPSFGMEVTSGTPNQEQIDLYDSTMTSVASNITATRLSDSTFKVASPYATAIFAMIHGAAAYQYCDDYPKGDYFYCTWLRDFRTNGENSRLTGGVECDGTTPIPSIPATNYGYDATNGFFQIQETSPMPLTQCSPRVVCFSPNGESWQNGRTYTFDNGFVIDERYGSLCQAQVFFQIDDPFWQAPHLPCGSNNTTPWKPDDGTCTGNYGHPPQVEGRITVPAGFPGLSR